MNKGEKELLHAILDKDPRAAMSHFEAWSSSIRFDEIEGGSYRLIPALYKKISQLKASFPHQERMKGIYRYFLFQTRLQMHQSRKVLDAFDHAQIDFMLLKGAALIAAYYESPALRPMNDIDILVKRADAERAFQLLQSLGWHTDRNRDFQRAFHTLHSISLTQANQVDFDLHWNVIYQVAWEGSEQAYWEETETALLGDHSVSILKPEMQVLHNIAHGLRFNTLSAIRWIPDVMLILEKRKDQLDWNHLLNLAKERRLVYSLRYGLTLLADEFKAEIPQSFLENLQAMPVSKAERKLHAAMNQPSRFTMFKAHWQIYMLHREKDPYWKRLIGLPHYIKGLLACETYREALAFILKKAWKHATEPIHKVHEPDRLDQ